MKTTVIIEHEVTRQFETPQEALSWLSVAHGKIITGTDTDIVTNENELEEQKPATRGRKKKIK